MQVLVDRGQGLGPQQGCQAQHAQRRSGLPAVRPLGQNGTCGSRAACEMMAGGALPSCWAPLASWVVAELAAALPVALLALQMAASGLCLALLLHQHQQVYGKERLVGHVASCLQIEKSGPLCKLTARSKGIYKALRRQPYVRLYVAVTINMHQSCACSFCTSQMHDQGISRHQVILLPAISMHLPFQTGQVFGQT